MIFGVGYLGYSGRYNKYLPNIVSPKINGKKTPAYVCWEKMLARCYNNATQTYCQSYIGCSVDEKWHNFQNFVVWFNKYYKPDYQLDKDLLVKGNKIYSENNCCLIPGEINKALETSRTRRNDKTPVGITIVGSTIYVRFRGIYYGCFPSIEEAWKTYKNARESYIKELAEKHKNNIGDNVYQALLNYQIEITD